MQVIIEIVVIVAAVILGLYWLSPTTTGNGGTDPLGSPAGIPFPVLWEQKLRQIASKEVQNVFAEQSGSIEDTERGRQMGTPPSAHSSFLWRKKSSRRYTPKLLRWCARGPRRCGGTQRP